MQDSTCTVKKNWIKNKYIGKTTVRKYNLHNTKHITHKKQFIITHLKGNPVRAIIRMIGIIIPSELYKVFAHTDVFSGQACNGERGRKGTGRDEGSFE